jgi:alanyl-tRNA synthetase
MLLSADEAGGKVSIAADVPKALQDKGLKAGDWARAAAEACGGKGGGRPDFAQAGGKDPSKLPVALRAAKAFANARLGA